MNPFKLIYKFCSYPQTKFWLQVLHAVIGLYLTLYALAFARYEFTLFSIDNKVVNLVTLAEGQNRKFVLERIPSFQKIKVPTEPKIHNIFSIIKSLIPAYDNINFDLWKELSILVAYYKNDLKSLTLNGINLSGMGKLYYDISFKNSYFEKVSFIKAVLNFNDFQYSKFIDTEFRGADLRKNDFSFSEFNNSRLDGADLRESNLCGAKLHQTSYFDTDFSYTNLIGVDLSNIIVLPHTIESVVHLENAYYNSQTIKMTSEFEIFNFLALHFPTCIDFTIEGFPPTKFPQGFDPEIYGMIDMSKLKNLLKPFNKRQ